MADSNKLSRFSRGKFYSTIIDPNTNETVLDIMSFKFSDLFNFIKDKSAIVYTITEAEEYQADLISFNNYGTEQYWWIVCLVNKITDPLTQLYAGKVLAIPDLGDVEEFYQLQRSTNKNTIVNI